MIPSKLKLALKVAIKARRPVMIWGSPGVGKSAVVRQVADELGLPCQDERVSDRDPVDFRGLPHIVDGVTQWTLPGFLPRDGQGVLFLDEISAAPPSIQAVVYQLILDRRLGDYRLPEGWSILAAGNLDSDRAVVSRMSTALANRFVHLTFEVSLNDWVGWALDKGIRPELVAFLRFRPELLHSFDPAKGEKSFPTPRTWEFVSDLMSADGQDCEADLIQGAVGAGAGVEFLGFLRTYRDLPEIDAIFKDPQGTVIPKGPGALYAVCSALARRVTTNATFGLALEYLERIRIGGNEAPEYQVLFVKDILRTKPELKSSAAFVAWAIKNGWLVTG
jgi:hypothetical protein